MDKRYGRYSIDEMDFLTDFLVETYGESGDILHEKVSDDIHLDILTFPPTEKKNHWTLVTMGMGAHPMETDNPKFQYAEVIIELPADWEMTPEAFKDERWYWPIRALKGIARVPIYHQTWFGYGHSVMNEEDIKFHGTNFTAFVLADPTEVRDELKCQFPDGRIINYYQLIPLHPDELQFKLNNNAAELLYQLSEANVTGVIDINRESFCG